MSRSNSNTSHTSHLTSYKITGSLLAKNTVLNFIGHVVPLFVALVTIPYIIHGLGVERFGILSLAWIVLGYFSIFDLGLGRATTKFVAEKLGKGEIEQIPKIIWTSLIIQTAFGVAGGIVLAVATPFLIERILKIPLYLIEETRLMFYILSLTVPIIVCSINHRGVLEAGQRFDLINAVRIPSSSLTFLIPAIGVFMGLKLPSIIFLLALSWMVSTLAFLLLCFKVFPELKKRFLIDKGLFRPLFSYGGWITLCNMLVPLLVYLDRFLIGALVSVAAVAYYTAPYEVVSRLLIFPGVLAMTLFPAFSNLSAINKKDLERLYARSLKYIILIMGPVVFVATFFAGDILRLWLGNDFAVKSTLVFQILAVGMLLNALSQMPANFLDGIGRPDLRAKIFLSYVLVYIGLLWFLISKFGIVGAALAWTIRAGLELLIFFGVSSRLLQIKPAIFAENGLLRGVIAYGGFVLMALLSLTFVKGIIIQSVVTGIFLTFFTFFVWRYTLDNGERLLFLSVIKLKGVSK